MLGSKGLPSLAPHCAAGGGGRALLQVGGSVQRRVTSTDLSARSNRVKRVKTREKTQGTLRPKRECVYKSEARRTNLDRFAFARTHFQRKRRLVLLARDLRCTVKGLAGVERERGRERERESMCVCVCACVNYQVTRFVRGHVCRATKT